MSRSGELWVFAYGSLIWNPGIAVAETRGARLEGFARGFRMWSVHHRGSEAVPGLVLALDEEEGAACEGLALRAAEPEAALAALRERELISSAYHERRLPLQLDDGREVEAVAYVVDRAHRQYAAGLTPGEQAAAIHRAVGDRGPNPDYLYRTMQALDSRGIADPQMAALVALVRQMAEAGA